MIHDLFLNRMTEVEYFHMKRNMQQEDELSWAERLNLRRERREQVLNTVPKAIGVKNHLYKQEEWSKNLRSIKQKISNGEFHVSTHVTSQMEKRGFDWEDVCSIFKNGTAEIIQGHAPGLPFGWNRFTRHEQRILYGKTNKGYVVHVVVMMTSNMGIASVYKPSSKIFLDDEKTLRPELAFKPIYAISEEGI